MLTDFARLDAMKDEDIDCSDIPPLTQQELAQAEGIWVTHDTEFMPLAISRKVTAYVKNGGKGYAMRMSKVINELLLNYIAAQHNT